MNERPLVAKAKISDVRAHVPERGEGSGLSWTHLDEKGNVRQVPIQAKPVVEREAIAVGFVRLSREAIRSIEEGGNAKGNVLAVARIAGIQGAKRCSDLIPLCHSLLLEEVALDFDVEKEGVSIEARCVASGKTGVEMEALTAVSLAALAIYDMCKAIDKGITFEGIRLIEKRKKRRVGG